MASDSFIGRSACKNARKGLISNTWPLRSSRCCIKKRLSSGDGILHSFRSSSRSFAKALSATHLGGWARTAGTRVSTKPSLLQSSPILCSSAKTKVASLSSERKAFWSSSWLSSFLAGSPPFSILMPFTQRNRTEVNASEKPNCVLGISDISPSAWKLSAA